MTDHNTTQGTGPALAGFSAVTKSLQSFAQEVARLSKESVDDTTQLVEKLRAAKTVEEVVNIQTSYVHQSIAKYADYTRKFGEMLTVLPLELVKQGRVASRQGVETVQTSIEKAVEPVQHIAEQAAQNIQHVPYDNGQNYNNQNYDNNQNYNNNNNNQNYNNQNYSNQNY